MKNLWKLGYVTMNDKQIIDDLIHYIRYNDSFLSQLKNTSSVTEVVNEYCKQYNVDKLVRAEAFLRDYGKTDET